MKLKSVAVAIIAMSMATGGVAFAQGRGNGNDRGDGDDRGRGAQNQRGNQGQRGDQGQRRDERRPQYDQRWNYREVTPYRGFSEFRSGDRIPPQYRERQYVVEDWRGHRLSAPPRGYQWVQNGSDYVLVAIATGVILQLLLNH